MYILIATIGFSALAVVSILDKFILTKKTTDPALYAFYSTIFALPLCLVFPFIALPYGFEVWIFSIVAGLFYGVALWTMYKGIEKGEVSHVGPLVGAAVPLFSIFLGGFFLKEVLSPYQIIAIAFLIFGSFILAFEKRKKGQGLRAGTAFGFLAGLIFAVSLVSLKFVFTQTDFLTGIILVWFFTGVSGLFFLFFPAVRKNFIKKTSTESTKRLATIIMNITLGAIGVILVQWAISLGPVTIVNSLGGVRYGLLVLFVAILSRFFPKIFKEEYTKLEFAQEAMAILLIAGGLMILL